MTIYELILQFKMLLDKSLSDAYPEFTLDEIAQFLNIAAEDFVRDKYTAYFESSQRVSDELSGLVVYTFIKDFKPSAFSQSVECEKPSDYWYSILESGVIHDTKCNLDKRGVLIKAVRHTDIERLLKDPFSKPNSNKILRMEQGNSFILFYGEGVEIQQILLGYIKQVEKIVIDTATWKDIKYWMPISTHNNIIEIAVNRAIETIESPRLQTQSIYLQNN